MNAEKQTVGAPENGNIPRYMAQNIAETRGRVAAGLPVRQRGQERENQKAELSKEQKKAVNSLIYRCSDTISRTGCGVWPRLLYPQDLIRSLDECHKLEVPHELVSSILFIFGLAGSEIREDKVYLEDRDERGYIRNITDLDPEVREDREIIERMGTFMNAYTKDAIKYCEGVVDILKLNKDMFNERISQIYTIADNFRIAKNKIIARKIIADEVQYDKNGTPGINAA